MWNKKFLSSFVGIAIKGLHFCATEYLKKKIINQ